MTRALVVVDLQFDFLPGGALGVPDGDAVVPVIERMTLDPQYKFVVATKDWHPEETAHFDKWPVHCVKHTHGATIVHSVADTANYVLAKGTSDIDDGYSGFEALTPFSERTGGLTLDKILREAGVNDIDVVGLALDYCIKATALDGIRLGYHVRVPLAATRPVEHGTGQEAIADLREAGVEVVG